MKGKTVLKILGVGVLAGGLVLLMSFVHRKQAKVLCESMEIEIPGAEFLITVAEVEAMIHRADSAILSRPITYAGLRNLERRIKESPYVEDVSVYAGVNGVLKVDVTQRKPLVRIINQQNKHFFLDAKGSKMPLSPNYTPRVLVASGEIAEPPGSVHDTLSTELARDILTVAQAINQDPFWKAQIGQIYVNKEQDMELIPRVGDHRIVIGNAQGLEAKLEKLLIFYRTAMPRVGWATYKVINLKYGDQIVATRADHKQIQEQ